MTLEALKAVAPEVAAKLEAEGAYICSRSAAVETSGELVDAIRMSDPEVAAKMGGYETCDAATWFEFVTKSLNDEDALKLANEAITPIV